LAAEQYKFMEDLAKSIAVVAPKVSDRLEVRLQVPQQPDHLDIAVGFGLQPTARPHPVRVSTAAQDETGQVRQLRVAGCEKVFREKITGTTADRPRLRELMKKLAPGDVVITPAVDWLSRDTTDLLIIARDVQRAGASIRSLAEPFLDTTSDFAEIIFAILGVAAKLERRRILERTARGRADAKEKGVKFGRKPTLTPHQVKEARARLDAGETQRSVARSYNVSQSTISRLEREHKARRC
jgi:DNA invertase Pin-like site-specific DNA recombinase